MYVIDLRPVLFYNEPYRIITLGRSVIFIETPIFTEDLLGLLSDDEYADFQKYLASNPLAGDVIQQTGGLRKIRWAAGGKGKRGALKLFIIM